jgi:hypothetical protein
MAEWEADPQAAEWKDQQEWEAARLVANRRRVVRMGQGRAALMEVDRPPVERKVRALERQA